MEKTRVLPCFFVKYTNISFKCTSCMIVPQSGKGLWVSNCNGWQTSHICRRGTIENVEKFISQVSFHNLSTPVPVSNRIFCFVLHFLFSLHQNKSIGFLTIFRLNKFIQFVCFLLNFFVRFIRYVCLKSRESNYDHFP